MPGNGFRSMGMFLFEVTFGLWGVILIVLISQFSWSGGPKRLLTKFGIHQGLDSRDLCLVKVLTLRPNDMLDVADLYVLLTY